MAETCQYDLCRDEISRLVSYLQKGSRLFLCGVISLGISHDRSTWRLKKAGCEAVFKEMFCELIDLVCLAKISLLLLVGKAGAHVDGRVARVLKSEAVSGVVHCLCFNTEMIIDRWSPELAAEPTAFHSQQKA